MRTFLTFTSKLTLGTEELISEPSNLIRRCWAKVARRQSNSLSLSLGLDREQKQVWERACKSETGGALANPSPLIAVDGSMLSLSAAFHNSWCLAKGLLCLFLADALLLIVAPSKEYFSILS